MTEIQLFDGDRLIFRAHPGEPLLSLLPEGEIDAAGLRAEVEAELRRLRPAAVADTGYQHRELDVLGEQVRVDVRNPANRELIRAGDLHAALQDASATLQSVAVTQLGPSEHRLATLLQGTMGGIPAAQLQRRLRDHIERIAETIDGEELRSSLARQAREAEDPRAVFALVSALRDAGLADEDDGVVRATPKLRRIRL